MSAEEFYINGQCLDPGEFYTPDEPHALPVTATPPPKKDIYISAGEIPTSVKIAGAGVVVAGLVFAPEFTVPALLLGAAGCGNNPGADPRVDGNEGESESEGEDGGLPDSRPPAQDAGPDISADASDSDTQIPDASTSDGGADGGMDAGSDAGATDSGPDAGAEEPDAGTEDPDAGSDGGVDGGPVDPDGGGPIVVDDDGDGISADLDCNDNDSTVFQNLIGYTDVDGDGYTIGGAQTICSGAVLAAGFTATQSVEPDCDDNDSSVYQNLAGYADVDGDGYTLAAAETLCSGAVLVSGFATTASALPDCDDTRNYVHPDAPECLNGLNNNCDAEENTLFTATDAVGFESIYDGAESGREVEVLDLNGDGFKDIAIASYNEWAVYIYLGSATGYTAPASYTFDYVEGSSTNMADVTLISPDYGFGLSLTKRKVEGDTKEDLIIGFNGDVSTGGGGFQIFKGRTELDARYELPDSLADSTNAAERAEKQVTVILGEPLDGLGDRAIVRGNKIATGVSSRTYLMNLPPNDFSIHNRGELGISIVTDNSFDPASSSSAVGNVNGGGIDLLVSGPELSPRYGATLLLNLEDSPSDLALLDLDPATTPNLIFRGTDGYPAIPGDPGKALVDLNGDGQDEVILGLAAGAGRTFVIPGDSITTKLASGDLTYGAIIPLDDLIAVPLPSGGYGGIIIEGDSSAPANSFPRSVNGNCDYDGDGFKDLVLGAAHRVTELEGLIPIFKGATFLDAPGIYSVSDADQFFTQTGSGGLGATLACGDINGDGYDDLLANDPTGPSGLRRGQTCLVHGGPTEPTVTLP